MIDLQFAKLGKSKSNLDADHNLRLTALEPLRSNGMGDSLFTLTFLTAIAC